MADNNPFSQYSVDDQNYIADQLRTARASGKLNPAQMQGIDNALKYLPMSKSQADTAITNVATQGMGTFRPAKTPGFVPPVNPEAPGFGGPIPSPVHPDTRNGANLVAPEDVYAERQARQLQAAAPNPVMGLRARTRLEESRELNAVNEKFGAVAGDAGAKFGAAIMSPYGSPTATAIGSGAGRFAGQTLSDPVTYATFSLGGLPKYGQFALSAAFAGQMGQGTVHAAGQLGEIWDREDIPRERKIELGTQAFLGLASAGLAGHTALRDFFEALPKNIPVEDKVELQQKIESHPQYSAFGKPGTFKPSEGAKPVENGVIDRTVQFNTFGPRSSNQRVVSGDRTFEKVPLAPEDKPVQTTPEQPAAGPETPKSSGPAPKTPIDKSRLPGESMDAWVDRIARMAEDSRRTNFSGKDIADTLRGKQVSGPKYQNAASQTFDQLTANEYDKKFLDILEGPKKKEPDGSSSADAAKEAARKFADAGAQPNDQQQEARGSEVPIIVPPERPGIVKSNPNPAPPQKPRDVVGEMFDKLKAADAAIRPRGDERAANISSAQKTPAGTEVPDLSKMGADERHEWVNKNAPVSLQGATEAEARQYAENVFGKEGASRLTITPYKDKDGQLRFGSKFPSVSGGAEKSNIVESPVSTFTKLTGGAHQEVLDRLWEETKKNSPTGTPQDVQQALYNKAVNSLIQAVQKGKGVADFQKAFDIVQRKSEGGFFSVGGRNRAADQDIQLLSRLHVDTVLTRFERLPDPALAGRRVVQKLQEPALRNSVYGANDPALEARYEDLLRRAGSSRASDPVMALATALDGHLITGGDVTRGALREALARTAHSAEERMAQFKAYRDAWNHRSIEDVLSFYDSVERGNFNAIDDPMDRAFAVDLRQQYDARQNQLVSMGLLDHFNDNYVGRLWKYGIKDLAASILTGKRNLAGTPSGLRARKFDTFSEGIANGLEPVSWNPVDMFLLKMHEMDKYLAAQNAFSELKNMGMIKEFDPKDIPWNWQRLNHQMFNTGGAKLYAPADSVKLFNRFLSPGFRGNIVYDTLANYNNVLNQFNLGFSAFHATETAVNATVSEVALGLQRLTRGDIRGIGNIAVSPARPFRAYFTGNKVLQEYMEPGRFSQMAGIVKALDMAGGRVRLDPEYKNAAGMGLRNAWMEFAAAKGMQNIPKAGKLLYRSLGAGLEKMSVPLMENFVPRVKLGVFAMMAQDAMERLGPAADRNAMRDEFSRIWDSVDNRFGQLVYDNLFWNRAGKDLAHLAIRSVGWNLGTARELGGAVFNLNEYKGVVTGKGLGYKQSYALGLLLTTGMMGYIMNAGYQGTMTPKIDGLVDLLYPATGRMNPDGSKERVYLKTYVHDLYGWGHAPGESFVNKLAPEWHQIGELYRNADYYGDQIHPIHASPGDALTDPDTYTGVGKYLLKSAEPFSVRNFVERYKSGEGVLGSMTSGAAVLPAPKWVSNTKAEALAFEYFKTKLSQGPNDPDKHLSVQRYHQLATGYQANRFTAKDVTDAYKNGEITAKQLDGILDEGDGKLSTLQRHVKQLEPHEFLRVWEVANPQEKQQLQDVFLKRWDSVEEKYPAPVATKLMKKFNTEWQTYQHSGASN